jgi:Flp pilus assembly pilin Flp
MKKIEAFRSWLHGLSLRIGVSMQTCLVRLRSESGQTVAEYALVLLVVAAIAVAFLLWARQSGKLDSFFDAIFAKLLDSVDPAPTPTP